MGYADLSTPTVLLPPLLPETMQSAGLAPARQQVRLSCAGLGDAIGVRDDRELVSDIVAVRVRYTLGYHGHHGLHIVAVYLDKL